MSIRSCGAKPSPLTRTVLPPGPLSRLRKTSGDGGNRVGGGVASVATVVAVGSVDAVAAGGEVTRVAVAVAVGVTEAVGGGGSPPDEWAIPAAATVAVAPMRATQIATLRESAMP